MLSRVRMWIISFKLTTHMELLVGNTVPSLHEAEDNDRHQNVVHRCYFLQLQEICYRSRFFLWLKVIYAVLLGTSHMFILFEQTKLFKA